MIVVPFTRLAPETLGACERSGLDFAPVELRDDQAYFWLLRGLWRRGRAFTLLEHDVVPHDGALAELQACGEPWCAFPYGVGWSRPCLGCSRFSGPLLARHPGLLEGAEPRPWYYLDRLLEQLLADAGERVHVHQPAVRHLHHGGDSSWAPALAQRGRIAAARARLGHLQ